MKILCIFGFHTWEEKIKLYKVRNPVKNSYDYKTIPYKKCKRCDEQLLKIAFGTGTGLTWKVVK